MNYGKNKPSATKLKRKMPDTAFEKRFCAWCEKEIIRKRQTYAKWIITTCCSSSCIGFWTHHKKPLREMPTTEPERFCSNSKCRKLLVRREDERTNAWNKRLSCNKSCAAIGSKPTVKTKVVKAEAPKVIETDESRAGVIQYKPGSPEFKKLAEQYLARGF